MRSSIYHRQSPAGKLSPPNPLVVVIMVGLWLAVGCALPLHRVHEARRQAHEKLLSVLAADNPNKAGIIATFEGSNQDFDAAASGPCLILAVSAIYLAWQLLKLKRRFNEVDLELRNYRSLSAPSEAQPSD